MEISMEDNARPARGFLSPKCFEIINMKEFLEKVDGGSPCHPICKHCQKNYEHKDIVVWFRTECKNLCCPKCGKELISDMRKTIAAYGSFLGFKVYKAKFQEKSVSSNAAKLQTGEDPSKQNTVCKLCKMEYEKDIDTMICYKTVCEDECCLDCGKAKCFLLWKAMKDLAPALEVQMLKEEDFVSGAEFRWLKEKVGGGVAAIKLRKVEEQYASDGEKPRTAQDPTKQIAVCQGTCSCCTRNKSKNTETIVAKRNDKESTLKESDGASEVLTFPRLQRSSEDGVGKSNEDMETSAAKQSSEVIKLIESEVSSPYYEIIAAHKFQIIALVVTALLSLLLAQIALN